VRAGAIVHPYQHSEEGKVTDEHLIELTDNKLRSKFIELNTIEYRVINGDRSEVKGAFHSICISHSG
jgi:hypothetical protein